jgi:Ca2+-transporting ATPase
MPATEVVVGDLVVLREGDRVPADGRLTDAYGVEVDESALTGESLPSAKSVEPCLSDTPLADRRCMVYAGTGITRGRGRIVVTDIGTSTEIGRIADLTAAAVAPPTPLQRRLGALTRAMVAVGVVITIGLGIGVYLRDGDLDEAFLTGVSVAVAAIPEGLTATVTVALALGARAMARRRAIVRRLAAVETLGVTTLIASDKTGTLTQNRLNVTQVMPADGHDVRDVLTAAVLASTAELIGDGPGARVSGDPVDGAILRAAREHGIERWDLLARNALVRELPFDAGRRRMTLAYADPGGLRVASKGAPEFVLEAAGRPSAAERLVRAAREWSAQGMRVIAVGTGLVPATTDDAQLESNLEPVGLIALSDPLRETAAHSVRAARDAGVRVSIVTGDHPATAGSIARELHVEPDQVFARVTPADKLGLVERQQARGDVVAVTGDGVNDAPALRQADVGIAMGASGTEAAREAADLILTDDDFSTIVAAIEEGRRVGDNIRKFVAFLLSANLGEVLVFAVCVLAGIGVPMTVVQVLIVNVLTDGLPAVALSRDPVAPDAMSRGPQPRTALFARIDWWALAIVGLLVGTASTMAYIAGRAMGGDAAQTMAFATLALAELVLVFSIRSPWRAAWQERGNALLVAAAIASAAALVASIAVPALRAPLGTVMLDLDAALVVAGLAVVPAGCVEVGKALRRRRVTL